MQVGMNQSLRMRVCMVCMRVDMVWPVGMRVVIDWAYDARQGLPPGWDRCHHQEKGEDRRK